LLRELGLVRAGPDGDAPTVACCLLFARHVPDSLRHAAVAVTRKGKGRTVVRGNLIRQQRELIALLDSKELNPPLKIKGKRAYEERPAYPSRSLTEVIVNLLVHRDYEIEELAEIDVDTARAVRFSNPGAFPRKCALGCKLMRRVASGPSERLAKSEILRSPTCSSESGPWNVLEAVLQM